MHIKTTNRYLPQRDDVSKLAPPRYTQQIRANLSYAQITYHDMVGGKQYFKV
jgi:hypothetical protein